MMSGSKCGGALQLLASGRFIRLLFALLITNTAFSSINGNNGQQSGDDCMLGSYRSIQPPFGACSGFKVCELGFFCVGGVRTPCPSGSYGDALRLQNSSCSGYCTAGYYCPLGSVVRTSSPCGGGGVFCPTGSSVPIAALQGHYTVDIDSTDSLSTIAFRVASRICPLGYYCQNGLKHPCPGGTYGLAEGTSSAECSGICPEGWYCPVGTISPLSHGCSSPSEYCPLGSSHPLHTARGYYAVTPHKGEGGGYGGQSICPRGSYCVGGVRFDCPPGRYGAEKQSTSPRCSGECLGGYYCPGGSISPTQIPCGPHSRFCPAGSRVPLTVGAGYYTATTEDMNSSIAVTASGESFNQQSLTVATYTQETRCEPGYYCLPDGVRRACPAGRFGSTPGLSSPQCNGPCGDGFHCPLGSTSRAQIPCGGPGVFCPVGSSQPRPVAEGYYSVDSDSLIALNTTRSAERRCEPGYFCSGGERALCIPGHWGLGGEVTGNCSGVCAAGYYCPGGSSSPEQMLCGDSSRYCPLASAYPLSVPPGYHSTGTEGSTESTRSSVRMSPRGFYAIQGVLYRCRAGFHGDSEGMFSAECSGHCAAGFFCPAGSVSPYMRLCGGDDRICPSVSTAPLLVRDGCYTADYRYEPCAPGQWRNSSLSIDPTQTLSRSYSSSASYTPGTPSLLTPDNADYSPISTAAAVPGCQLCPLGTYKSVSGDDLSLCLPCDSNHSTSTTARILCKCTGVILRKIPEEHSAYPSPAPSPTYTTSTQSPSYTDLIDTYQDTLSYVSLVLTLGYSFRSFNQPASDTNTLIFDRFGDCQSELLSDSLYRDDGEYYGLNTSLTRSVETPCEPGSYCVSGQRYLCPAGRYSALARENRPMCAGPCAAGYYCPLGSVSNYGIPCGNASLICPEGSGAPFLVPPGSFSSEQQRGGYRSSMEECGPGYYCPGDGLRYPCPAGTYSDQNSTVHPSCLGACDAGYYCPIGSSSRQQLECGGSPLFCPEGSGMPETVHPGFYSIFTGPDAGAKALTDTMNTTMSAEIPCDPGYYCAGGVKTPCPPGTFAWRYGLNSSTACTLCAAGYYCPSYLLPQPASIAPAYTVWPGHPQTVPNAYRCGSAAYYCPLGSPYPQAVSPGSYSTGGGTDVTVRTGEQQCSAGTYCKGGGKVTCPRGYYGAAGGLSTAVCSGLCPAGFYCPPGTFAPLSCPQSSFALAGSYACIICPGKGARYLPMPCQTDKSCCSKKNI